MLVTGMESKNQNQMALALQVINFDFIFIFSSYFMQRSTNCVYFLGLLQPRSAAGQNRRVDWKEGRRSSRQNERTLGRPENCRDC